MISAGSASGGPKSIGSKANGLVELAMEVAVWDRKGLSPLESPPKSSPPIKKGFRLAEDGEV